MLRLLVKVKSGPIVQQFKYSSQFIHVVQKKKKGQFVQVKPSTKHLET